MKRAPIRYNTSTMQEENEITIDHGDENLDDSVLAEGSQHETIKKLREKLRKSEQEKQEHLDGWQRSKADFINARRRDDEAKQDFLKFSKEEILKDIIPVLDSFDLAFRNQEAWKTLPSDWRTGIESIYNQLLSVLGNHGIQKLVPKDDLFDPKLHEAIQMVRVKDKSQNGKIVEVVQAGYSLLGKEIRSPKVIVASFE